MKSFLEVLVCYNCFAFWHVLLAVYTVISRSYAHLRLTHCCMKVGQRDARCRMTVWYGVPHERAAREKPLAHEFEFSALVVNGAFVVKSQLCLNEMGEVDEIASGE